MQLFSANATMFSKKFQIFSLPIKSWIKPPSKVAQKNSNLLFSLLPAEPKWPKQKNSCSKMWLIHQLYIELGFLPWQVLVEVVSNSCRETRILIRSFCWFVPIWWVLYHAWQQFCWEYRHLQKHDKMIIFLVIAALRLSHLTSFFVASQICF